MKRLITVMLITLSIPVGVAYATRGTESHERPNMPVAICHQYCAIADAETAYAARALRAPEPLSLPVAICHQYCAIANAEAATPAAS
jgi:hypothetical protein